MVALGLERKGAYHTQISAAPSTCHEDYHVLVSATLVPHGKETATQQTSLGFPKTATFLNPSTLYWSFQSLPLKGEGSFRVVILTGKHQVLPLTRNRVAVVNPVPDGSVRKDVD